MSILMDFEKNNSELVAESYFKLLVIEKILEIMEFKNITQNDLAKEMGISKSQISRLLADDRNLTMGSVAKIFHALGETPLILTKSEVSDLKTIKESTQQVVHLHMPYTDMPQCPSIKKPRSPGVRPVSKYQHIKMSQNIG